MTLAQRIADKSATVGIVGLGYVGLPLAVHLARTGYHVTGIDISEQKAAAINRGESYIQDIAAPAIAEQVHAGRLQATSQYDNAANLDIIFICVPTPYNESKAPDITYIQNAAHSIAAHLRPGQLIVLQSTTYPGTTEEDVLPILESSGLKAGKDFYLAFSPERVDPGNHKYTVLNTPKVVGGLTPECGELTRQLLSSLAAPVHVVSSPRVAEMTKLLENTFRAVNIAMVNELALLCERMGIDIWEVIEAASSKPFGYMPFTPGPGPGGHCIPVDPHYLAWKARQYDFSTRFIELAASVNEGMPYHVVNLTADALNLQGRAMKGARVMVLGVAFKKNIDDARESPARRVIEGLLKEGADVIYNDPHIPRFSIGGDVLFPLKKMLTSTPLDEATVIGQDCLVILAAHSAYDYPWLVRSARLIVDAVDATRGVDGRAGKVVRLGAPRHVSTPPSSS
jgi:UDP-N-acetyl-D-glucosamine dehydrogenase